MLYLTVLLPLVGGLSLLFLQPKQLYRYCYAVVGLTALLVASVPFLDVQPMSVGYFSQGISFTLAADEISIFFGLIFVVIWLCVLRYATGYLAHDANKKRFFAFYVALLSPLLGVCYSQNFLTLYLFFELVTLTSFPLVAHEGTEASIRACKKYIYYSLGGALLGLIAVFYLYSLGLDPTFTAGGIPGLSEAAPQWAILAVLVVSVVGFGCKAGLFPLHGWLKTAHPIAPAPASAVLSGITTKAGVIAILRMIYYVIGPDLIAGTQVQTALLALTLVTIFLGSMLACREGVLKTRLAYSSVSQLSYILFALLLCNKVAFVGALLHVLFHALAKNQLFLSAGTVIHETGYHRVDELNGLGLSLRPTFLLFTVASLSLVGVPLFGGFVSKWYIAVGAVTANPIGVIGVGVIMLSALLTACYLLTISTAALLPRTQVEVRQLHPPKSMISPTLAVLTVVLGIYPAPVISFLTAIADKLL